jgi:hypothetical protein
VKNWYSVVVRIWSWVCEAHPGPVVQFRFVFFCLVSGGHRGGATTPRTSFLLVDAPLCGYTDAVLQGLKFLCEFVVLLVCFGSLRTFVFVYRLSVSSKLWRLVELWLAPRRNISSPSPAGCQLGGAAAGRHGHEAYHDPGTGSKKRLEGSAEQRWVGWGGTGWGSESL